MPGKDVSPDFTKKSGILMDSRNSEGRMGQGKGLEDCRQKSCYKMPGGGCQRGCLVIKCLGPVSHHQISITTGIPGNLVRKGRGERFCWRIVGENSLYKMPVAGCKGVASL